MIYDTSFQDQEREIPTQSELHHLTICTQMQPTNTQAKRHCTVDSYIYII
jgi:hypothetical protein